jgi:hypothetical protein
MEGDLGKVFGVKKTGWENETRYRDIKVLYIVTDKVKKNIQIEQ